MVRMLKPETIRTSARAARLLGLALLALALGSASAQAQGGDDRWMAFVGCWTPVGVDDALLCFEPAAGGVQMLNVIAGEVTSRELIVADGRTRTVSAEGCTGTESVEFSENGLRAFTRTSFVCDGEERAGTGIMSFIGPDEWVDVRSLSVEGEPVAWAQRYTLATPRTLAEQGVEDPAAANPTVVRAMRARAADEIDVADVEEATRRMDARAVEVWVATQGTELELDGDELVRLADSGVPESVIDVMVAVSYPERFAVTPEGAAQMADLAGGAGDYRGYRGYRTYLFDPFYYDSYYGWPGSRWRSYYSPFGFYGYGFGGYGGYWGYRPATIIVRPVDDDGSAGGGRMVPGRGYTRRSPSSGQPSPSVNSSPPRSDSGRPSSRAGPTRRSGGDSGSRSGGSTGRTARPR